MKIKRIMSAVCCCFVIFAFTACEKETSIDETDSMTEEIAESVQTEVDSEIDFEETDSETVDFQLSTHDTILNLLESSFEKSYGDDVLIESDEDTHSYFVSIWEAGMAESMEADENDELYNAVKTSFDSTASSIAESIRTIDPEASFTIKLLDDRDMNSVIIEINK